MALLIFLLVISPVYRDEYKELKPKNRKERRLWI